MHAKVLVSVNRALGRFFHGFTWRWHLKTCVEACGWFLFAFLGLITYKAVLLSPFKLGNPLSPLQILWWMPNENVNKILPSFIYWCLSLTPNVNILQKMLPTCSKTSNTNTDEDRCLQESMVESLKSVLAHLQSDDNVSLLDVEHDEDGGKLDLDNDEVWCRSLNHHYFCAAAKLILPLKKN